MLEHQHQAALQLVIYGWILTNEGNILMATRLKTVEYAFPVMTSLTNNVLTNFTQITVYLPESGTKTIRKAWVEVSMDDIITATGGSLTTKTVNLRLGAASYTSTTNDNTLTNTTENLSYFTTRDFTSHFTTNWTGTSMTCDVQVQVNQSTGTTLGMVNVCCTLFVTYEYDDSSTTQLKTVWIPLNAPVTALPTTKTSHDTVPALDTYLPEASKTFRDIHIVTQANANQATASDHTITYELTSLGTHTTGNYESALSTSRWTRYVWSITSYITTNSTHTFNVWSSLAGRHHSMQAWLVVTYEFNASTTTSVLNSLLLPMEIPSPMGGTSAADFQRASREIMVQESNPTLNKLAFCMLWQASASETGLNARIGTGSFVAYTNTGALPIGGNKGLMIRNDAPTGLTFARGRNVLQMDVYNTSDTQRGGNVGGFWILNYTSDKHTNGVGAHNHTIMWPLHTEDTTAAIQWMNTTAGAPNIPESNYFISALGFELKAMIGTTSQGLSVKAERLAAGEGGLVFEPVYTDIGQSDTEMGLVTCYAQARTLFYRWPGDNVNGENRLDPETARRYVLNSGNGVAHWNSLIMLFTYHTITYSVADSISGFSGTVNLDVHRASTGEKVLSTTRSGDGAFSFTWYDNTEELFVSADDGTNVGRSEDTLAS